MSYYCEKISWGSPEWEGYHCWHTTYLTPNYRQEQTKIMSKVKLTASFTPTQHQTPLSPQPPVSHP